LVICVNILCVELVFFLWCSVYR